MGDGSASIQAAQAHPGQSLIIAGRGRLNHLLGSGDAAQVIQQYCQL